MELTKRGNITPNEVRKSAFPANIDAAYGGYAISKYLSTALNSVTLPTVKKAEPMIGIIQ